jgi:DNA helicase-2/ATP-dependent DNA helicase PcrA
MDLSTLNDKQKEAVTTTEGPLLVLAGAGSGKTKVLTTRVAYLIEHNGINPKNILAITFTNKAAKEMKERVIKMLGPVGYDIQISTFHSFGLLITKENYKTMGYNQNFTIIDSDDSLSLIKKIMREHDIDPKQYNYKAIRNQISGAKNELFSPEEYSRFVQDDFDEKVLMIYRIYQQRLIANNSLDFDDLLMKPIMLLRTNPDVLKAYQERFQYILVDEYQDTNQAQYQLIKMLGAKYKNVCVVGDNDQAIYSWRQADYRNILNFEKDYKDAKTIMLEENYRSTATILNAANDVIKHNKDRKDKNLWTDHDKGNNIKYHRAMDEKDEAYYVTTEIKKLLQKDVNPDSIAILYRTNAQSRNMEEALLQANIPYKVVGSFYFYNRGEIKDLIAYLKLLYNNQDDISLMRVINVPKRGIGIRSITNLQNQAIQDKCSMFEAIKSGKELEFKELIKRLEEYKESHSLTELVDYVLEETGIKRELEAEKSIEADARLENLEEFKSITKSFEDENGLVSLEDFLEQISLVSDIEEHKNETNVITLMTVHSAKGLEFDYVFIIGLEEGIFPHKNSFESDQDMEEERRLCYVAITRAKLGLYLVNAHHRMLYGMDNMNPESRFIKEIEAKYLDKDEDRLSKKDVIVDMSDNIDENAEYKLGDKVDHIAFGRGIIVGIDDSILTIAFPHPYGIKKILKGHKSIRKV